MGQTINYFSGSMQEPWTVAKHGPANLKSYFSCCSEIASASGVATVAAMSLIDNLAIITNLHEDISDYVDINLAMSSISRSNNDISQKNYSVEGA